MTVREWPGQHSQFLRCLYLLVCLGHVCPIHVCSTSCPWIGRSLVWCCTTSDMKLHYVHSVKTYLFGLVRACLHNKWVLVPLGQRRSRLMLHYIWFEDILYPFCRFCHCLVMLIVCHMFAKVILLPSVEVDVDPGDSQRGAAGQHWPPPHIRLHLERDEQVKKETES